MTFNRVEQPKIIPDINVLKKCVKGLIKSIALENKEIGDKRKMASNSEITTHEFVLLTENNRIRRKHLILIKQEMKKLVGFIEMM